MVSTTTPATMSCKQRKSGQNKYNVMCNIKFGHGMIILSYIRHLKHFLISPETNCFFENHMYTAKHKLITAQMHHIKKRIYFFPLRYLIKLESNIYRKTFEAYLQISQYVCRQQRNDVPVLILE